MPWIIPRITAEMGNYGPPDPFSDLGPIGAGSVVTPERHPTVRTLASVSALQDLGSKMTVAILPLFLTGPLGASVVVVGLLDGIADLSAAVSRLISGRRSDRGSRSDLVRAGYGTAMMARVRLALAWAWPIVLAARFIDRIGKGVRAAAPRRNDR